MLGCEIPPPPIGKLHAKLMQSTVVFGVCTSIFWHQTFMKLRYCYTQIHFQYIKHSLTTSHLFLLSRPLLLWPSLFALEFPLLHPLSRGSAPLSFGVLFHPGVDLLVHALVASRPLR